MWARMIKTSLLLTLLGLMVFLAGSARAFTFNLPAALNSDAATSTRHNVEPVLTTDGAGTWVAIWFVIVGGAHGDDLYFARTTDNGKTWSNAAPLKTNNATDNGTDYDPSVATDSHGHWVVVWRSTDTLGGTLPNNEHILVTHSNDNGLTWSAPGPIEPNAVQENQYQQNISPSVATDGAGHWITVWSFIDNVNDDSSVYASYSSDNGATWSARVSVQTAAGSARDLYPTVASDGHGRWMAAWQYPVGNPYVIQYSTSNNNGTSWQKPAGLSDDGTCDNQNPSLAADGAGHWVAAWHAANSGVANTDGDIHFRRTSDNGATWSPVAALNGNAAVDNNLDRYVKVVTDRSGVWMALWTSFPNRGGLNSSRDLLYAISYDYGTNWTLPAELYSTNYQDRPIAWDNCYLSLATDNHGRWITAWSSNNLNGNLTSYRNVFFSAIDLPPIRITSPNGGEVWNGGAMHQFDWYADPALGAVTYRCELLKNSGWIADLWSGTNTTGNMSISLSLPLLPAGSDYTVRVVNTSNPQIYAVSAQPFTVTGTPVCVRAPNGGETWTSGQTAQIQWESNTLIGGQAVRLELWKGQKLVADFGLDWNDSGKSTKTVLVPPLLGGNNYRVHAVSLIDPSWIDASDAPFTIMGTKDAVRTDWTLY